MVAQNCKGRSTVRQVMHDRMVTSLQDGLVYQGKVKTTMDGFVHLNKGQCGKGYGHPNRFNPNGRN